MFASLNLVNVRSRDLAKEIDKELFSGRFRALSRLPQYLERAILLGA